MGASRAVRSSIMVTLGTGVGGGIIIDRQPWRGIDGTAGEIGHVCVEPFGHPCGCGSRGCVEQYASATGIVRMARQKVSDSAAQSPDWQTSLQVYEAAITGNPAARNAFELMAFYLAIALTGLINALNP